MSIAGIMMQRMGMGLQHYGMGNVYSAMDSKLALARNVSFGSNEAVFKDLANKDLQYDLSISGNKLDYLIGEKMYEQGKRLQNEWAKSFSTFA